jgi:hypothetical protein
MNYPIEDIQKKIAVAIKMLFINDSYLLEIGVHERTVAHKLAEYLQDEFPDWHVDCEYNKNEEHVKLLKGINECHKQKRTERIYPDIIIHKRGRKENLLVIELKTNGPEEVCDIRKLELLTKIDGGYEYRFGLFIRFNKTNEPTLKWYKSGILYEA